MDRVAQGFVGSATAIQCTVQSAVIGAGSVGSALARLLLSPVRTAQHAAEERKVLRLFLSGPIAV